MIRGSADSDDDVPSTIRISSPMYRRKRIRLKPVARAIAPRTMNTKKAHVRYTPAISFPSASSDPSP